MKAKILTHIATTTLWIVSTFLFMKGIDGLVTTCFSLLVVAVFKVVIWSISLYIYALDHKFHLASQQPNQSPQPQPQSPQPQPQSQQNEIIELEESETDVIWIRSSLIEGRRPDGALITTYHIENTINKRDDVERGEKNAVYVLLGELLEEGYKLEGEPIKFTKKGKYFIEQK